MITLSLCMIVRNEEEVLARCLMGVSDIADEIIIVDTGSTDQTVRAASRFTPNIYYLPWTDDFSAARNYAFSKASCEYCMWLDADDIIEEEDRQKLLLLKKTLSPATDMVMMKYITAVDDNGKPSFWYYRERIIRNDGSHLWQGVVHEAITPSGTIVYSDAAVTHKKMRSGDPDRNLLIYEKLISSGSSLNARELYYYARELYYHKRYQDALQSFQTFLSLPDGWIENKIESCILGSKCYRELKNPNSALQMLLKSLEYDTPRAEVCCELGNHFLNNRKYETAIFWYQTAIGCQSESQKNGFVLTDCYGYIPALQLCVCYDRLGMTEKAMAYNETAESYKPGTASCQYNRDYFSRILGQS